MSEIPYPPPPPPQPWPQQPGFGESYVLRTGLATAALVLGILGLLTGCVCIGALLGVLAIVLGIVALVKIGGEPALYGGRGRAIGGIVTGGLSLVLTAVLWIALPAVILTTFGSRLGVISAAVDLQNVGQALQAYHTEFGSYPPDLRVLRSHPALGRNPFDAQGDPTRSIAYVQDVGPDDPPHWIRGYMRTELLSHSFYGVLYADGTTNLLESAEFEEQLARFRQEYEAQHGAPPDIQTPAPGQP